MDTLPSSLCACGTLAVWFPQTATTAANRQQQQQQQRGATATAATTTATTAPSSLLGPAFAALKSSASASSAAGQWLVGKKPATLTMSASGRGGVLVQIHAGGRRLVALSSPFPAACRMVPPSATTGGGAEGGDGNGGGGGGCWVLVAGVREEGPPPSSLALLAPRGEDARGECSRAPGSEGQLLAKVVFRVDASSDGAGLDRMLRERLFGRRRGCGAGAATAAKAATEEEDKAGGAPAPVASLPPVAAAENPGPPPLPHRQVEETTAAVTLDAAAPGSLDAAADANDLDLAALAELGDDEQLAALLAGMLREGAGGDELFRRVFERVDGAVTELLMMASAHAAAEGDERERVPSEREAKKN